VLTALERHGTDLLSSPSHPLLNSGSIHASLISGGQELSSYPERCVLHVERRTVPGETPESVSDQLEMLLNDIRERDADFRAEHRVTLSRDTFEVSEDEPIVECLRRHVGSIRGSEPRLAGVPFWMDSALLSAADIPTVIFGPDGEGAHAVIEWVDVDSVTKCLEVYEAVIAEFCA
jgi:acetylornithine deacetylase